MLGLGYDLCFSVGEDTSLAGALIEVYLYIDISLREAIPYKLCSRVFHENMFFKKK